MDKRDPYVDTKQVDLGPPVTPRSETGQPLDVRSPLPAKGDALDAFRSRPAVGKSRDQRTRPAQSGPRFPAQSHKNRGGKHRPPVEVGDDWAGYGASYDADDRLRSDNLG